MALIAIYGFIVGLSLGLTGGGGSIFAVPLLVYGAGVDFRRAVTLSLAVVGLTALYGAVLQARRKQVLWGAGGVLGLGGITAAPLGVWIGKQMPERVSLLLFASLMIFIGVQMLRRKAASADVPVAWFRCQFQPDGHPRFNLSCAGKLLAAGASAGVLSGIFGVGGGFLIVPSLLVVACVSMERALATSLVAIFLIAASGFAANAANLGSGDTAIAAWFPLGSMAGMTAGAYLKTLVRSHHLRILFALSILGTAAYVVARNLGGS